MRVKNTTKHAISLNGIGKIEAGETVVVGEQHRYRLGLCAAVEILKEKTTKKAEKTTEK